MVISIVFCKRLPEGRSGWVLIISMFSQADGHFLGNIPIPSEKNARRDLIGVDWGRVTPMYTALSENGGYP